jgi:ABC-2 type transport system permease protein
VLETRRQYDDGTIPSTGEKPNARPITGVFGLHVTLQRGQTVGWAIGLFLAGLTFGSMTKSLLDAAKSNELLARVLAAQGNDGVYTTMTQFLAAAATAYVVSAVLRVYSDEQSGLGEPVLAGAVSRWQWLFTAVASALVGSVVLMFFAGLGNGLGAGITVGEPQTIARLTMAALAYVPALAVIAGVAALAVALRHAWIGWLAVTFVITALYLGALLRLPQWLIDLSPVGRTTAPSHYPVAALTAMVVVAAALTLIAGWIYRGRDAL